MDLGNVGGLFWFLDRQAVPQVGAGAVGEAQMAANVALLADQFSSFVRPRNLGDAPLSGRRNGGGRATEGLHLCHFLGD